MKETRQSKMVFSTNEMLYLVGSLRLPYNLLLGDPFRGYSKEDLKSEMENGRHALEDKGLLKKVDYQEWELDDRIVNLFELLASTDYSFFVTSINKPAAIEQHVYFYKDRQGISINLEGHLYHLGIYYDEKTMMDFLLPVLGINQQLSQGFPEFNFPSENFAGRLLEAWKNPGEVARALQATGLDGERVKKTMRVLDQVQSASILLLKPKPAVAIGERVAYLVTSRTCLWWGEAGPDPKGLLTLKPLVFSHIALTRPIGSDELLVSFDPARPNIYAHLLTFIRGEATIASPGSSHEEQMFV
jgi:hypothetical protein